MNQDDADHKKQIILEMYVLVDQPGFNDLSIQELYNTAKVSLNASKKKLEETQYEMIELLSKEGGN